MLSVKRDKALKAGVPPPGQPFPKEESKKLGVDVCLLPNTKEDWQEDSLLLGCDSDEDPSTPEEVAAALSEVFSSSGVGINGDGAGGGGGGGRAGGEGGEEEERLRQDGSADWDVVASASAPAAPGGDVAGRGGGGEGPDRVAVVSAAVSPAGSRRGGGEGGEEAAAAGADSGEQP